MSLLLQAQGLNKRFQSVDALDDVSLTVSRREILAVVGESGSGKSTLLATLAGLQSADSGRITYYGADRPQDIGDMDEMQLRRLQRTQWGFIHQNARAALRLDVSAGGNIGERLMMNGARDYGEIRETAARWLDEVEIGRERIDEMPLNFSGGMLQRLQIAATLVTSPELVFMDEPTTGLDVSVQARVLDLIRNLVHKLDVATIIVTHDLGVARLLADRTVVMQGGAIVEHGLTDQVLDDPQHPYTQLLVSSVLPS